MVKHGWLVAIGLALHLSPSARADDAPLTFTPRPAIVFGGSSESSGVTCNITASSSCSTGSSNCSPAETPCRTSPGLVGRLRGNGESCGTGSKCQKLLGWLFYTANERGCVPSNCEPRVPNPPMFAYFMGKSGCTGCGAAAAAPCATGACAATRTPTAGTYFATKPAASSAQPATTPANPVAQVASASDGETQSAGTKPAAERRMSTYKPDSVARTMPVLSPAKFRQPPPPQECCGNAKK